MAISMLKIRRPLGRLIFKIGIAIPGKTVFLIDTAPSVHFDIQALLNLHALKRQLIVRNEFQLLVRCDVKTSGPAVAPLFYNWQPNFCVD